MGLRVKLGNTKRKTIYCNKNSRETVGLTDDPGSLLGARVNKKISRESVFVATSICVPFPVAPNTKRKRTKSMTATPGLL